MADLKQYGGWALVTGASSGIGREFARAIAAQGVDCVLVARRQDRLEELAEELRGTHRVQCRCVPLDLAEPDAVPRLVESVKDIPVGVLVNNAGFGHGVPFETSDPAKLTQMVNVNCAVPALLTRALLPAMLKRKRGAVIIVASTLAVMNAPYEAVYAGTKAFDLSFGMSLWAEMRGRGVDVLTLCPAGTKTEFFAAQGHPPERQARFEFLADMPEKVAAIALRRLGKRAVTGPISFAAPAFITRFLPRSVVTRVTGLIIKRMMMH
jgi:uncharacterized protein